MKLARLEKGSNNFALVGLTLGKLQAIQHALEICVLGPVGEDVLLGLKAMDLEKIECFGDSHTDKSLLKSTSI